jgi:hypothetical protein
MRGSPSPSLGHVDGEQRAAGDPCVGSASTKAALRSCSGGLAQVQGQFEILSMT